MTSAISSYQPQFQIESLEGEIEEVDQIEGDFELELIPEDANTILPKIYHGDTESTEGCTAKS